MSWTKAMWNSSALPALGTAALVAIPPYASLGHEFLVWTSGACAAFYLSRVLLNRHLGNV